MFPVSTGPADTVWCAAKKPMFKQKIMCLCVSNLRVRGHGKRGVDVFRKCTASIRCLEVVSQVAYSIDPCSACLCVLSTEVWRVGVHFNDLPLSKQHGGKHSTLCFQLGGASLLTAACSKMCILPCFVHTAAQLVAKQVWLHAYNARRCACAARTAARRPCSFPLLLLE